MLYEHSVGQFRSAGGLVLPSGRKLGPQMFLPLVPIHTSYHLILCDHHKEFAFRNRKAPDPWGEIGGNEARNP
jgi:hypothetical protein